MHFQLGRRFFVGYAFAVEIAHPHDLIESLHAHRPGVHPQAAADGARDSFHPFKAADPRGFPA